MPQGRKLSALLGSIRPPMEDAAHRARQRWDACAKPLGSLGLLEDMVTDMAALVGTEQLRLTPRAVLVLCADNGVVAQGVSQSGCEVTGTRYLRVWRRERVMSAVWQHWPTAG